MIEQLIDILRHEREHYPSTAAMASDAGVSYDTLYALLTGTRKQGVSLEIISQLANKYPQVSALFLSPDSPISKHETAGSQTTEDQPV